MKDVEFKLRKLEPAIGKEMAGKLWKVYLGGSAKERRKWEEYISILADIYAGDDYQNKILLPPPTSEVAAGEYPLGTIFYPDSEYCAFGLREEEFIKHVGIFGASGSGKTNVAFLLIDLLKKKKKPFLIFDWKKNYRPLITRDDFKDLLVFTVGSETSPFSFNPLIPPRGVPPRVWLKKIIEVIAHAYFLGEGVMYLLQLALDRVYSDYGVYDGTPHEYPTFRDVEKYIMKLKPRGREMLWHASTKRTLASLCFGPMDSVVNVEKPNPLEGLLNEDVVLELDALTESNKTFLIEALLLWVHHHRLNEGKQETFKHAIIIEEAHHVFLRKKQARDGTESITDVIMREIRELGESVILIDQHPSLISLPALGNTHTTISMNLKHGSDVAAMARAILLDHNESSYLGLLEVGSGIVKLQSRHPFPFLVRFPPAKIKAEVPDSKVREHMARHSGYSIPESSRIEVNKNIQSIPHPVTLSPLENQMLKDIAKVPLSGVVKRYKRLGLSMGEGNKIKNSLVRKNLVKPVRVNRIRFLDLTERGVQTVQDLGLKTIPARGGIEHEYWRKEVMEHLKNNGFKVSVELNDIDLVAQKGTERIALEIETGKSDMLGNIEKCISQGFATIISLATNRAVEFKLKQGLKGLRVPPGNRVEVFYVADFLREKFITD